MGSQKGLLGSIESMDIYFCATPAERQQAISAAGGAGTPTYRVVSIPNQGVGVSQIPGSSLALQVLLDSLDNDLVVPFLLQATHDDHADDALDTLDAHGKAAAVDSIVACALAQHVLGRKLRFVSAKLVVHVPRAEAPT